MVVYNDTVGMNCDTVRTDDVDDINDNIDGKDDSIK